MRQVIGLRRQSAVRVTVVDGDELVGAIGEVGPAT